jgi:hypothetical protein
VQLPAKILQLFQRNVTVAQLVEHGTHKPGVAGSIPARDTKHSVLSLAFRYTTDMQISLRQDWKLAHIMALALIFMVAFFIALFTLPFPKLFAENTLYYFVIVPYGLTVLQFESTIKDYHALPSYDFTFFIVSAFSALTIYSFFFAIVTTFVSKKKVIPLAYVGLYVVLSIAIDKLFGHLF